MPIDPGGETVAEDEPPRDSNVVAPGARIGKYRLIRLLGRGGMGAVWAAHDPELDREVAIKVLRSDCTDPSLGARLRREARAMARLKHPNVLTVHEVGNADGRDFIAMELVDGTNLDAWLVTKPSRKEIWRALVDAGRGLAAAHAAGLVHRDFKPANVLRSDAGHVMVTDFGLARGHGDDASRAPCSLPAVEALDVTAAALDSALTVTGMLVGTPAYMAPEQFEGPAPDPRTDQFAFCVTAWQALTGSRPFRGDSVEALRDNAAAGAIVDASLPRPIRAALVRGLDPDPAKRWPDLDQLITAIDRAVHQRPRQRRAMLAVGGGIAAVAITAAVAMHASTTERVVAPSPACAPGETVFAEAWSPQVRDAIANNLSSPHAGFDRIAKIADDYRAAWLADYAEVCRAPDARTFHERVGCLLAIRDEIAALTPLLHHLPTPRFDDMEPFGVLPSLNGCKAPSPATPPSPPSDPASRRRIAELRGKAFALVMGTRDALPSTIDTLVGEARDVNWPPLVAEVEFHAAAALQHANRPDDARVMYDRAATDASGARHAHIEAVARIGLVEVSLAASENPNDPHNHSRLVGQARAAVAAAGDEPVMRAALDGIEGRLELASGRPDRAIDQLDRARHAYVVSDNAIGALALATAELDAYLQRDWDGDLAKAAAVLDDTTTAIGTRPALVAQLHNLRGGLAWANGDLDAVHREWDAAARPAPRGETIDGRVDGPDGKPAARATVVAWTGSLLGDARRVYTGRGSFDGDVAVTDDAGQFSIFAPPGSAIIAELGELRSAPTAIGKAPLAIRLGSTRTIAGSVTSASDPITGVVGFARFAIGATARWNLATAVDRDGAFRLANVPAGTPQIGATDDSQIHVVFAPAATPTLIAWPATGRLDVIVRGADPGTRVWVLRGRHAPKTISELAELTSHGSDVATTETTRVGDATATTRGREIGYAPDDVHAVIDAIADGEVTACAAVADHPPACNVATMRLDRLTIVSDPKGNRRGHLWAPARAVLVEANWAMRTQRAPTGP